jgi:hypothetical protein
VRVLLEEAFSPWYGKPGNGNIALVMAGPAESDDFLPRLKTMVQGLHAPGRAPAYLFTNLQVVELSVAANTKRYEIILLVATEETSRLDVVYLKVF